MSSNPFLPGVAIFIAFAAPTFCDTPTRREQIESHSRKAQEFLKTNRPDLAADEFKAIVNLDPNNVDARGNLGVLLFFQGDYKRAAQELRATLKLQPALWKIQALLGMSERRTGQAAGARSDLEKAFPELREEKIRVQAGLELIEIYYSGGELDRAAGVVSVLRQLRPTDVDILYTAQRIYSDLSDESMLSIALLAPDSARMHQLMAHEAARQGNTDGAIAQYKEALKLDPQLPGLHFELAEALSGSSSPSDRDEVEKEYKAALAANPFDEKSECRLGEISSHQSDQEGAFAHYSRAVELQPNDADANVGLAKTLIAMNQPEKALPLLERAAKLDPFSAVIRYHLSTAYRRSGRAQDAQRELAEFRRLRGLKGRLNEVYSAMRLQPIKQERPDPDVPK
jgi:tetratricopeptide (TPR) repeat protein